MSDDERGKAAAVASWMKGQLEKHQTLYQDVAVHEIQSRFGPEFTYLNDAGNPAIDRKVLAAFRSLTEGSVVWERGERCWRRRESYDPEGRVVD